MKETNQRSNNEIEASSIEVEVEDVWHVIVEIGLHTAVARLALIPWPFSERHFRWSILSNTDKWIEFGAVYILRSSDFEHGVWCVQRELVEGFGRVL